MYESFKKAMENAAKINTSNVAIISDILEDTLIIQIRDVEGIAWYYEGFYIRSRDYGDIYDEIIDSLKEYNICKEISARYKKDPDKTNLFELAKEIDLAMSNFRLNLHKIKGE